MIFELAENYSSDYFIAKAFILLADIYVIQENDFQAKATLESIIENHEGEDLVNLARKKWELIVEREVLINKIKEEPQSYIEILEQEINYDLEEVLIEFLTFWRLNLLQYIDLKSLRHLMLRIPLLSNEKK